MTQFIQIHVLTNFAASNVNRDDTGRSKSMVFGGTERDRISSQALKRAIRTGPMFEAFEKGVRTRHLPTLVTANLLESGVDERLAKDISDAIAVISRGEAKKDDKKGGKRGAAAANDEEVEAVQGKDAVTFFSGEEFEALMSLAHRSAARNEVPERVTVEACIGQHPSISIDVAMSGRMLAKMPRFNVEAAVAVAHAFSVHKTNSDVDYFTAVDDLSGKLGLQGTAHLDDGYFTSSLFYGYACVNLDLLVRNCGSDGAAAAGIQALVRSLASVYPSGKRASFASWGRASYMLVERGTAQPRQLSTAFLEAIQGPDIMTKAVAALREERDRFERVYGDGLASAELCVPEGVGTLAALADFAAAA